MNPRIRCYTEESQRDFGNGVTVSLYRMTNGRAHYVECCNYGGRIVGITVPDRNQRLANIVLHYPKLRDYLNDVYYLGATIGPIANRITDGEYEVEGYRYRLPCNDGNNCNHSGAIGLDKMLFAGRVCYDGSIVFSTVVPRSDAYSATLEVSVHYSFSDDDELIVDYWARADAACCVNLTNHTYFNLSGGTDDVSGYRFQTSARRYLVQNESFLPTGEIRPLSATEGFESLQQLGGFLRNTYYVFDECGPHDATLWDDSSGRLIDVVTTQPGILLYSGGCLGDPFRPYDGVCLETQGFPDAPSHEKFPSIVIKRNHPYWHRTIYKFSTYGHERLLLNPS